MVEWRWAVKKLKQAKKDWIEMCKRKLVHIKSDSTPTECEDTQKAYDVEMKIEEEKLDEILKGNLIPDPR